MVIATDSGVRHVPVFTYVPLKPWVRSSFTPGSSSSCLAPWTFLVTGMKQGWAFAWPSLMAAEIYVTILKGVRARPMTSFGREIKFNGTGYWRPGCHRRYWVAGGQNSLLALGTISSSSLGNRRVSDWGLQLAVSS
jgi:hypothetical protein